jgi:hypothetical protein
MVLMGHNLAPEPLQPPDPLPPAGFNHWKFPPPHPPPFEPHTTSRNLQWLVKLAIPHLLCTELDPPTNWRQKLEAMAAVSGAAFPVTPSKIVGSVAIEKVVRSLNDDYGLGIEMPDPTLSPSRRKQLSAQDEQYARWDRICRGLQFLYYQRGNTLDQALAAFFNEAKAASLRWVPKPRADPGTLPSATTPPRAQTAGQQWNLQSILIGVIDDYKAHAMPALLLPRPSATPVSTRRGSRDASSPKSAPESPDSPASKRSFDSDDDHEAKRLRAKASVIPRNPSPTPSAFTDALDKVPTRRRLGYPPDNWSPQRRQPDERSTSSHSSNGSSVSSIFSHRDGPLSTQTTLDEDSREQKRSVAAPTHPSPPRFNVAHRSGPRVPTIPGRANAAQQSPPRSSALSTDYSDFPDPSGASLDQSLGSAWARDDDEPLGTSKLSALQLRLQNIWRKSPMRMAGVASF